MRVSIEEDPALGVHTYIWVTNVPKCWEGVQGRKCLPIKWDKLVTEKPDKSKQPVVDNWRRPSCVLEVKVEIQCHRKVARNKKTSIEKRATSKIQQTWRLSRSSYTVLKITTKFSKVCQKRKTGRREKLSKIKLPIEKRLQRCCNYLHTSNWYTKRECGTA